MKLINLTPHSITVVGFAPIPASGNVARVSTTSASAGNVAGLPLSSQATGEVTGLPEAEPGTMLIVSTQVRLALPGRKDLVSPGELVRDSSGQPVGCTTLVVNL